MEYNEEDYLMLSGIQHFAFCKRQWALIHIEQQWAENYRTTSGELMHKRAHQDDLFELRGDILTAHNLRVSSRKLGVTGQCDIVEFHRAKDGITLHNYEGMWNIVPVEYNAESPKMVRKMNCSYVCRQCVWRNSILPKLKKDICFMEKIEGVPKLSLRNRCEVM